MSQIELDEKKAQEREAQLCFLLREAIGDRDGYCGVDWDGMLCWNSTAAGETTNVSCPSYFHDFKHSGFAKRVCLENGTWPVIQRENYNDCIIPHEHPVQDLDNINLMAHIGYTISLVSLLVAVLIMLLSRRLHCKSNSLHINLFLAFILRAVSFLLFGILFVNGIGLESDITRLPDGSIQFNNDGSSHWECKLITSIRMYTISSSMMWILMEGMYLHMLVYKTLLVERSGVRNYVLIGWLSPLLYIIPWIVVRSYLDDTMCWNNDEYGYRWIIIGPILLSILINIGFFINIIRFLCARIQSHRNMSMTGNSQQVRKLAKFALVLIPLFGVTYIVTAAFPVGINKKADIIYVYWDMFYNSFQGFILAVLFCFLNEEVHNEIRRCWHRRRHDSVFTRTFSLSTYRSKGSCRSYVSHNSIHDHKRGRGDYRSEMSTISEQQSSGNGITVTSEHNGIPRAVHYKAAGLCEQKAPLMD